MSKKDDILSVMREWAPEHLAESWDNVGMQLDTNREIDRVAIALELNLDTWDIISQNNYDLIITHHPLIFKPIKSLGYDSWEHTVLRELISNNIGLYVSHTNLDRASLSVTDALMRQFEFDFSSADDLSDNYGRIVHLNKVVDIYDIEDKVQVIAKVIPEDIQIKRVALCGGSGKSFVKSVIDKHADIFITGELGYHEIQHFRQQKVGVILLGHYQSESFILDIIKDRLHHIDVEIDVIK